MQLALLNFRILMMTVEPLTNSRNNILPDGTVVITFSLCYNKLDQFERTSAPAEEANSSLIHFGRKIRVTFRFDFRRSCSQAQNKKSFAVSCGNTFFGV